MDLGAESGRVMAVSFDGRFLHLQELHRFPNTTVTINGTLHWDFLRLWGNIQAEIEKRKALNPASIGVDTWGVDFGLLDSQGNLIGNPVHYRDGRTANMMVGERVWTLERLYNLREGFTKAADTLPGRLLNEPVAEGPSEGFTVNWVSALEEVSGIILEHKLMGEEMIEYRKHSEGYKNW